MRILVVDDMDDARELTEAALLSAGYKDVVSASSAWEAIKLLDLGRTGNEPPYADILLLDIVMPEMDGIEACARIRKDPRYADIPIIMVTTLDDMESLSNAFVAGATDYVTKPINRIELVARVRAALRLKAELERRQARERELLAFMSTWGDRRANMWIDPVTGLFVGEVAEAYLSATAAPPNDPTVSIIALSLDRFEVFRAVRGAAEANEVLASVAHAVRGVAATLGVIAAAYRDGMMIVIAPEMDAVAACQLGKTLCDTVAKLRLRHSEGIAADHITASVGAVTGQTRDPMERIHLLTRAIAAMQNVTADGGNHVLAFAA